MPDSSISDDIPLEKIDRLAHAVARPGADLDAPPPCNYIFWLGAGFSKTAGIPLAEGVVDRLLDLRWRPTVEGGSKQKTFHQLSAEEQLKRQAAVRAWAKGERLFGDRDPGNWADLYGECLRLLPGEVDRQEFIIQCIEEGRGRLNLAHLLLGQLIKNGFVDTVFTTNFDDLILRSLQLYFVVPSVLDPDSTNTLLTNSRFVQVGYLHGRLASYRQRHTTTEVNDSIPGLENYLAQALKDHGLVVIGYRGNDETPLSLLHKVLSDRKTGPGRGLFWVTRDDDSRNLPSKVRELLKLKDCYWLPNWDADDFMQKLCAWRGIGLGIPSPSEWTKGMEDMLPVQAKTLFTESQKDPAVELAKAKEATKPVEGAPPTTAPWFKAARDVVRSDPSEAVRILTKALPESEQSVEALKLWANAFEDLGRSNDMLAIGKKAIDQFDDNPIAHQLLARALYVNEAYDAAVDEYRRALELGGEPFWLKRSIGVALYFARRLNEAEDAFRESFKDAVEPYEQAQALSWLAGVLTKLGKHAEAIKAFEDALKLRPLHYSDYGNWADSLKALGRQEEAAEKLKLYETGKVAKSNKS